MHIGIAGYGKMGRAVELIARERAHQVSILTRTHDGYEIAGGMDCVIEFTHASVAPELIRMCISEGTPVISGTTGWDPEQEGVYAYCNSKQGALLWSPNFSVGMQIVYALNQTLAKLMDTRPEYEVMILETHHTEKKDKPSGTAIALAQQILHVVKRKTRWILSDSATTAADVLPVVSERIPDVKGIHRVTYSGPYDVISLRHKALSRDAFALGAVLAAEWLPGKTGVFTFADVLKNVG